MATPIKSLFSPIEKKKPFLLNKQKAGAVARRRVSTEWRLHWGLRVEPTACVCFSFTLSYCYLFYLHYLFYAISTVILFNFSYRHMHACYLFVYSHTSWWTHKSFGPELVLFKIRKERFRWQVWLMSTDAHLDFRLDCNSPYATSIVESFSPCCIRLRGRLLHE